MVSDITMTDSISLSIPEKIHKTRSMMRSNGNVTQARKAAGRISFQINESF